MPKIPVPADPRTTAERQRDIGGGLGAGGLRRIGQRLGGTFSTTPDADASLGCHSSSRTARRNRSVAARTTVLPSISSRTPVSIGSVSSRPAANATLRDGLGKDVRRDRSRRRRDGGHPG